jgi:tRNA (guanine-N7-)-methyltransferase
MSSTLPSPRLRRWTNPYRERLAGFSGRIFQLLEHQEKEIVDLRQIMQSKSAVICEIGSGSGNHLIGLGRRAPEAAVFGFEPRYKRAVRTIEKAQDAGVSNVYVVRAKSEMVPLVFADRSVDRIYVNFPEPWDKLSRRKHRVLDASFLDMSDRILRDQGDISVKTDHREYYRSFRELVQADGRFRITAETEDFYQRQSPFLEDNIASEFELLFKNKGEPICHLKISRAKADSGAS